MGQPGQLQYKAPAGTASESSPAKAATPPVGSPQGYDQKWTRLLDSPYQFSLLDMAAGKLWAQWKELKAFSFIRTWFKCDFPYVCLCSKAQDLDASFCLLPSLLLPGKLGFVPAFLVSACWDSLRNLHGFIECISKEMRNTWAFLLTTWTVLPFTF